jgi:hypothetical protein
VCGSILFEIWLILDKITHATHKITPILFAIELILFTIALILATTGMGEESGTGGRVTKALVASAEVIHDKGLAVWVSSTKK